MLIVFMSMMSGKAFGHDIEVANADGVTIYYIWNDDKTELAVSYKGTSSLSHVYSGDINIPESVLYEGQTYQVTKIGRDAFRYCSSLTSITIPNSVTIIGDYAFYECSGLKSITIPNNVTNLGNATFSGCSSLASITIPNSVTSIGNSTFSGCSSLTSITIPNSVTSIGDYVLTECSGLISIVVESDNSKYDSRGNCNAIIETASNTLISGCKNTIIPNTLTSIGYYAFAGCNGLTIVTSLNPIPSTISSDTFSSYSATLQVPIGSKTAYQNAEYWKNFTNIVEIDPTGIQSITLDKNTNAPIYDLNGRKLKEPSKGINIIGGKKVVIK